MGRPAAFRDPDVLTHAMMLFWKKGYAGTGIRDLEKATGLTASSLYNRFGSKQILFLAALDHYIHKVVQHRIERYLRAPDPVAGLIRFLETTWDYIDDSRAPMACLLSNSALEFAGDRGQVQRHIRTGLQQLEDAFSQCLDRACDNGALVAGSNTRFWAQHLLLCLQGLLVASTVADDRLTLAQHTRSLLAALPWANDAWTRVPQLEIKDGRTAHTG